MKEEKSSAIRIMKENTPEQIEETAKRLVKKYKNVFEGLR
jgi:predicted transcriptional regulator